MAATKLQFQYGTWTDAIAKQMSLATPGLVVFNYGTHTIYVDGNAFGMNDEEIAELLNRVKTLEEFRKALYVADYAQAAIADDATSLTIFGIKQGEENSETNSGKIAKSDDTQNLTINFAAAYDKDNNKIALESNLKDLKAEILGTLDPEELEKTLDTIREIQEQLVNGAWRITNPDGEVIKTTRYPIKEATTIGGTTYPAGSVVWTDGTDPVENATVYASQLTETSDVVYTTGYKDLKNLGNVDTLVAEIDGIKDDIQNNLVEVSENESKSFVTSVSDGEKGDSHYTIGVNYGTFKTGHGNVMDETSTAFVDGIATVEAVQKYIEERLTWVSFETDAQTVATSVNNVEEGGTYTVSTGNELNNSLLIKNNNN